MTRITDKYIVEPLRFFISISLCCLLFVSSISIVSAKDSNLNLDPLRPADNSSPRDTLRCFLTDASQYIEDFRQNTRSEKTFQAYRRASQTLDFSNTPEGDSWFVRNRQMALLQELLTRIELPPDNQIPGDPEVADGTITE